MKVFCISGKAQHGKDTTATLLKEILESGGGSVLIAHYGDLVKYVCKAFFGWDGKKDEHGRSILQYVGTDIVRRQNEDFWVGFIRDMLRFFDGQWEYVLIPDTRFPNEVEAMREAGFDVTHIRVKRENFKSPLTEEQQKHRSETALDDYPADQYVNNNGTISDLKTKLSILAAVINEKPSSIFHTDNKQQEG